MHLSPLVIGAFLLAFVPLPAALAQCGNANSPYGINSHAPAEPALTQILDKEQAAGVGWLRIDFLWTEIEPAWNTFDWSRHDAIAAAASARGLRIFGTLAFTPQWATSGAVKTGTPDNPADWYDFCFRCARRYPGIQHWGMWNEPNLTAFWTGTRQQYIDVILKNGADAIHAGNPGAKVCGPELAHKDLRQWYDWLRESIDQSAGKLDVLTHHLYDVTGPAGVTARLEQSTLYGTEPSRWSQAVPSVKEVLAYTGWLGRPFWLTEVGWASDQVGETTQATYYNGLLTDWFTGVPGRNWLHKVFFYEIVDDLNPVTPRWGILRSDYSEKPSFASYHDFITAHPARPALSCAAAVDPTPAAGNIGIGPSQPLSWTAGTGALSHDVYFGTSSPGTFRGNQVVTSYNPGALEPGVTYYWRIDEVGAGGTTQGEVWSFTTTPAAPPDKAVDPSPAHLATLHPEGTTLSWSAGSGAVAHNVYFGLVSPGALCGMQADVVFDPGPVTPLRTYYWRIDEVGPAGAVSTGDVWQFTTTARTSDLDDDGDVDQSDFGLLQQCMTGSGLLDSDGCMSADLNGDRRVNGQDLAIFRGCMSGTDQPPGC